VEEVLVLSPHAASRPIAAAGMRRARRRIRRRYRRNI
jgi:hypothetical protein